MNAEKIIEVYIYLNMRDSKCYKWSIMKVCISFNLKSLKCDKMKNNRNIWQFQSSKCDK